MAEFEHTSEIAAPLEALWAFHQDPLGSLPLLAPPDDDVKIQSAEPLPPREGTRVILSVRGPLGVRMRWVAVYECVVPPRPVAFGYEARFVDVQESGPFAAWRHEHDMEYVDARTSRLTDRIVYRPPLGPLGWLADWLVIRPKLKKMFVFRHAQTRAALETQTTAAPT